MSGTIPPIQAYVYPVCIFKLNKAGREALILKLQGTAFLIGDDGYFLTAAHVLTIKQQLAEDEFIGLCIKASNDFKSNSAAPIKLMEIAPESFDIAIGKIDLPYKFTSPIKRVSRQIRVLDDIHTYGYPETASDNSNNYWGIGVRAHKGYIQRIIGDGSMPNESPPHRFETNFLIGLGMSGSPLLDSSNNLIGICVGSARSEIVDDQFTEIGKDGSKYTEMKLKVEEHGIAHAVSPIMKWKPTILNGRALIDLY